MEAIYAIQAVGTHGSCVHSVARPKKSVGDKKSRHPVTEKKL